MDGIRPIVPDKDNKVALYVLVYDQLFRLIESNYFKEGEKLPSETTLAQQLGVSRGSLRQALLILQEDGIIKNVQGKGNILVKSKKNISVGLERLCNPAKTFNNKEYDDISIEVSYQATTKWLENVLLVSSSTLIMVFNRKYKVKDEYVCYAISFVPYERVSSYNLDINDQKELLNFIDDKIYEYASTANSEIELTAAGDFFGGELNVSEDKSLMLIMETMFSDSGEPMAFSKFYCNPEFYNFHLNRRKNPTI